MHCSFCNETPGGFPDWKEGHRENRVKGITEDGGQKGRSYSLMNVKSKRIALPVQVVALVLRSEMGLGAGGTTDSFNSTDVYRALPPHQPPC